MNIFGVGLPEVAVISALALIIFGPKRLPELGRTLGKTLKGLQTASTEFEKEIQKAMNETDAYEEGLGREGSSQQNSENRVTQDDDPAKLLEG